MENINLSKVRVRIAPSPTGFVHIGNLRTMLYNYLFAKHNGGKFIIRVEDTDRTRIVPGAIEDMLGVLSWAGMEADEGPYLTKDGQLAQKGDFGPYVQSERLKIYHDQMDDLLDKGKAYHCFCSKQRLDDLREKQTADKQAPGYDGFCRNLNKSEVEALLRQNTSHVIRFKMPEQKEIIVKDIIRGEIVVNARDLDDYVLMKADGYPTYHFASIVDDHLMKITHVLRADEWIASAPKHVLLYEAFGWQPPQFAHLPQLLNKQKKKLSKRDGDTSVKDFIDAGYLRDALLNFIALLGWNAGTEQEIYSMNELIKQFDLGNVHKSGAVFDVDKLDWLNGNYIRKIIPDDFVALCLDSLMKSGVLTKIKSGYQVKETGEKYKLPEIKKIILLEQTRLKKINEIWDAISYFFANNLDYKAEQLIWRKADKSTTIEYLRNLEKLLLGIKDDDFNLKNLEKVISEYLTGNGLDTGTMLWPMRYALSGRDRSPNPYEIADALGKIKTLERINFAVTLLM